VPAIPKAECVLSLECVPPAIPKAVSRSRSLSRPRLRLPPQSLSLPLTLPLPLQRPEAVLPDRVLYLPTFNHLLIVNKLLSLPPRSPRTLCLKGQGTRNAGMAGHGSRFLLVLGPCPCTCVCVCVCVCVCMCVCMCVCVCEREREREMKK
jgi:hypothetical protein